MGLDERLIKDNRKKTGMANRGDSYYEDEPDWLMYDEKKKRPDFNKDEGVFANTDRQAINTRKSVFDSQAVFKSTR